MDSSCSFLQGPESIVPGVFSYRDLPSSSGRLPRATIDVMVWKSLEQPQPTLDRGLSCLVVCGGFVFQLLEGTLSTQMKKVHLNYMYLVLQVSQGLCFVLFQVVNCMIPYDFLRHPYYYFTPLSPSIFISFQNPIRAPQLPYFPRSDKLCPLLPLYCSPCDVPFTQYLCACVSTASEWSSFVNMVRCEVTWFGVVERLLWHDLFCSQH